MNNGEEGLREELLARGARAPVRGDRPAPAQDNNEDPLGLRAMGLVPMMMSDDDDSDDDGDDQDDLDNDDDDQVWPYRAGTAEKSGHTALLSTRVHPVVALLE